MKLKYLTIIAILLIIFSISFGFPATANAQESGDILITKTDFEDYPKVDIYIYFKEGSELEALDLKQEDFIVLENGEKVRNLSVMPLGEILDPIGVVLLLDTSGSMIGEPIADTASAASLFLDEMRRIDEFSVASFADDVIIHSGFTLDRKKLKDSISEIKAQGETSLFDGIFTALDQFKNRDDIKHRYIIVLSDGMDTVSKHNAQDVVDKALQEGVIIYSIALLSSEFNPDDIRNISGSTGGEMLVAVDSKELKELYKSISKKIINQYRISYTSLWPNAEDIVISISVEKSGLTVTTETGYENPYYYTAPTKVMIEPERPFYLTIFDKWWAGIAVYSIIFIMITLLLYSFILFIPVRKKTLKEKASIYGHEAKGGRTEGEFRYGEERRRGPFGWISRIISRIVSRRGFIELFGLKLERAGMRIRASEFITLHLIAVIIISIALYYLTGNLLITLLVLILVVVSPFLLLNVKTSQRLRKFHGQLPDVLQLISGSLKAGYGFNQALSMVVDESRPPISDEFRRILSDIRMGLSEKEALENIAERINSEYFNWTVMAINVHREVGGNLAEVLEIISDTIRERDRVMNRIKALTSEGKLSAIILLILPVIVGLLMFILNREYLSLLVTTKLGMMMLLVAGVLMIAGVIWIIKIIQIKY